MCSLSVCSAGVRGAALCVLASTDASSAAVSMSFDSGIVCEHPRPRPRGVPLLCQRGPGTTERLV